MQGHREVWLAGLAAKRNRLELKDASEEMKSDRELCMAAVAQHWRALEFASKRLRGDRELCMAAVAQGWQALALVSKEMKGDRELCRAAVAQMRGFAGEVEIEDWLMKARVPEAVR